MEAKKGKEVVQGQEEKNGGIDKKVVGSSLGSSRQKVYGGRQVYKCVNTGNSSTEPPPIHLIHPVKIIYKGASIYICVYREKNREERRYTYSS